MFRLHSVLTKYAGHAIHAQQTSAYVRQRALTLLDISSGRVQYMEKVRQGRKELPGISNTQSLHNVHKGQRQKL